MKKNDRRVTAENVSLFGDKPNLSNSMGREISEIFPSFLFCTLLEDTCSSVVNPVIEKGPKVCKILGGNVANEQ